MAITDNKKIIIKVCQHYYNDGLSQKEISAKLSISRPQISRILAYAKANNIITVKFNNPFENETKYENKLIQQFGLEDAIIFDTDGYEKEEAFKKFAEETAIQLETYISNGNSIGVMSGRTLSAVIKAISGYDRHNLSIIPLVGGDGFSGSEWHANIIAKEFAKKTKSEYFVLNAPVIVENPQAALMLKEEPFISKILIKGASCDITLIGIGNIDEGSTSGQASHLQKQEINELKKAGAVAALCTSYLDSQGHIVNTDVTKRIIGQSIKDIKKSKTIAIAIGTSKCKAIEAVLKSGYIDVLISNVETINKIIN